MYFTHTQLWGLNWIFYDAFYLFGFNITSFTLLIYIFYLYFLSLFPSYSSFSLFSSLVEMVISNPFRSTKWRQRSTTTEINDISAPIAPPSPPDSTIIKKDKPSPPFNSDSLLDGIGDYIFESPLGGGKFSKVLLSYHYLTGLKVAIKVINKFNYVIAIFLY